jgi:dihydrofolate reductase
MMERYWPAVARGDEEALPAMRDWAVKLEAKPKYVVSSTRTDFPWTNSHHIAGDLRTGVQKLKDATPAGVLLGSGKLATELDRLDLIDEYKLLVHPRIVGHGPTLYERFSDVRPAIRDELGVWTLVAGILIGGFVLLYVLSLMFGPIPQLHEW